MLVKIQSRSFIDDYGILVSGPHPYVHMFENGIVPITAKISTEPVVQVRALWMAHNAKVTCDVADTDHKKRIGLQSYSHLEDNHGMYFPYPGCSDVSFHQGSVPFSLDLIFLRDGTIAGVKRETVVGSKELWHCNDCDGVIEVNAGYCEENSVAEGDRLIILAYSQNDIDEYQNDRLNIQTEFTAKAKDLDYRERAASLMHAILGKEYYGK